MTFEYSTDLPNEMDQLYGLSAGFGVVPLIYLISGGAAAGAALVRFLESEEWSTGEYNDWMRKINDTLHTWDTLGWSSKCWDKNPAKRKEWLAFWARFSKHYAAHGVVSGVSWVSDSEEKPARNILNELLQWGEWLNKSCGVSTGAVVAPPPPPKPEPEWMGYVKWGAIGLAAIAAISLFSGVRDILPRRRDY